MNRIILIIYILGCSCSFSFSNPGIIRKLEQKLKRESDTVRIATLLELSKVYLRVDGHKADSIASIAYSEAIDLGYYNGVALSAIYLGNIYSYSGDAVAGKNFWKEAFYLSDSLNSSSLLSECYNLQYLLFYRSGNYDSAHVAAKKSMELAGISGNQKMLARGSQNLGILNSIKGDHVKAVEHFLLSEKYYKELGDEFAWAMVLGNLGVTLEEAGNYVSALEYMRMQLEIGERLNDRFLISNALADIGAVFSQMNLPDSSIKYYEQSLIIAQQTNNHDLVIINLDNIGSYYSNIGNFSEATRILMSAHNMALENGFEYENVYISGHLAQNFVAQQKYDSALIFALEQLKLATEYDFLYDRKLAHENLAIIYAALEKFKEAYESQMLYATLSDSIFSQEKSAQIESLREQYESGEREREIENLKAKNEAARYRNISYAGAAISFLILGGLLYNMQRQRVKRNQFLLEKEKELDRMKSRFFANISHEFRTPLTLILGPINEMIEKTGQLEIRKKLGIMQRSAQRLLDLVNQLLDLSKIESGQLKMDYRKQDIISVLKGVVMSFHSAAEQQRIKLRVDIAPDQLVMSFDQRKIETILINLLSNSLKFTPENGVISVESSMINENNDSYRIKVADTGHGIPKDELEQIFNRFYQSESNKLRQHEGSGIGLALAKEFVELHEGQITASSIEGEGTEINIELPINLKVTISETASEDIIEERTIPATLEDKESEELVVYADKALVLVIEDHEDVRKYIQDILMEKYKVVLAGDGLEGLEKAEKLIPDLIISDVMMPEKNGYEVCQVIKTDEKTSHIPLILLTAKSDSEDKIEGLESQADDYVTKPFVPKELLARVHNLIASRKKLRQKYNKEGVLRPNEVAINSVDEQFLNHLIKIVEAHIGNEQFGVVQLAYELNMSRSQLHRKLKALLDQGPNQFIRSFRLQRAHDLLAKQSATTAEIAYQVGFSSPSYFTKCFHEQFSYTPSEVATSS